MKKLLFVASVALLSLASFAEPCAATTKAGAPCKGKALEGSKYCMAHAKLAKAAEKAAGAVAKAEEKAAKAEEKSEDVAAEAKDAAEKPAVKARRARRDAKEAVARLKDDGTCWAVGKDGQRCTTQKVGESDYCAEHAADKKPAQPQEQCLALTWKGTRCQRKPEAESYYCAQHAKLGAAKAALEKAEKSSAKKAVKKGARKAAKEAAEKAAE